MVFAAIASLLVASASAGNTVTYRDGQGRKIMSASCHEDTVVYRGAAGRKIGEAKARNGKTIYRDASGRKIGEVNTAALPLSTPPVPECPRSSLPSPGSESPTELRTESPSPPDDFSLLRQTMEARAIDRLGVPSEEKSETIPESEKSEEVPATQQTQMSPGELLRTAIGVIIALPMMLIIGTTGVLVWLLG